MKISAKEFILSNEWPKDKSFRFAVAQRSVVSDGQFNIVYFKDKPMFHVAADWTSSGTMDPSTYRRSDYYKEADIADWKETIVTLNEWLSAQPPAQPMPQVGETWMTSNGPVKIVYISCLDRSNMSSYRFCGKSESGGLCIYGLEELKPMPTPRELFVNSVMAIIDEHIEPATTILDIAILISDGQLDAELAALGYTKTNQQ